MWKSMSKGELVVIYIIWLLSAAVFIFGSCHFLGIGEEFIQNIIPSGSIEVSEELAKQVDEAKKSAHNTSLMQ